MPTINFPVTLGHCNVSGAIMGTAKPVHFDVVSRPDGIDIRTGADKAPETMTISNEGVASYLPLRTHNTVLDAAELHRWGTAMRACAKGLYEPSQRTSFRQLGAKLDAIANRRPVHVAGCGPRGC